MLLFKPQVEELIRTALNEDIKGSDITTDAIAAKHDPKVLCEVVLKNESAIVCGLPVFKMVFDEMAENNVSVIFLSREGQEIFKNEKVLTVEAKASTILYAERTALNFLQHLSGIATAANLARKELKGLKTRILDTRKTIPGLRHLQKYAVKTGGGENHRFDLSSGILIKDNHIKLAGGIKNAISAVMEYSGGPFGRIEIETTCIDEVEEALNAGAHIIMLDNMEIAEMKAAVKLINGKTLTEASGNITFDNIRKIAGETGVDYISMGSLTNAPIPADYSLNFI